MFFQTISLSHCTMLSNFIGRGLASSTTQQSHLTFHHAPQGLHRSLSIDVPDDLGKGGAWASKLASYIQYLDNIHPPDTYAQCHPYLLMLYLQMCPIYPSAITNVPNIQTRSSVPPLCYHRTRFELQPVWLDQSSLRSIVSSSLHYPQRIKASLLLLVNDGTRSRGATI